MTFFSSFAKTGIFSLVKDPAYNQRSDLTLHYRTEVLCSQQTPAPFVENIDGIFFRCNGLDTVKHSGNVMVLSLKTVVDITVMVIVRST